MQSTSANETTGSTLFESQLDCSKDFKKCRDHSFYFSLQITRMPVITRATSMRQQDRHYLKESVRLSSFRRYFDHSWPDYYAYRTHNIKWQAVKTDRTFANDGEYPQHFRQLSLRRFANWRKFTGFSAVLQMNFRQLLAKVLLAKSGIPLRRRHRHCASSL